MNKEYYSNIEFSDLVKRINQEMLRRSTYTWWDPLALPTVGEDRLSPLSVPDIGDRIQVTDETYTINNPSTGSIEETRNIDYPAHGVNPAGRIPTDLYKGDVPNTSAAEVNVDEMKNMLVGLSKIQDINLFYGRDEMKYLAFRNPIGIETALRNAENSRLNSLLHESDISPTKNDPNGGMTDNRNPDYPIADHPVTYPMKDGVYVMPSGEYDGEEIKSEEGLGPSNFYDDYGALPGNSDFHPINRYVSEQVRRDWYDQDNQRNDVHTFVVEGGKPSSRFGQNPRNPQQGNEFRPRNVYGGNKGSCVGQCTGLCYVTCDNQCSESCNTTCWSRCGNACSSSCGNKCTSCSGQCMQSCKTKCENITGYSCLKAGAKTVKISTTGGTNGVPAQNNISYTLHTCSGCSYSCQFYPNKKTECWDSGCMGKCFISCNSSCSTSCYGGCIDNAPQKSNGYKSGKGRGCSAGCTLNCIGSCSGICAGQCINTCFNACKQSCSDNCFMAGTLIETIDGPIPIEQLKVGDKVLTKSGEYHPITRVHSRLAAEDETFQMSATGVYPIYTTREHPFWIKKFKGIKKIAGRGIQHYNKPEWINVEDISHKDRLCLLTFKPGNVSINPGIAYMVGRWLGDGWRFDEVSRLTGEVSSRFGICCGYHEETQFDEKIKECGVVFTKSVQETIIRYDILRRSNPELISLIKKCGKGAKDKFIPREFFSWNRESLINLLQGYIDADGHIDKDNDIRLSSVSKKLSYGIMNIFRSLGRNPSCFIREYDQTKDYFIENRKVNLSNAYTIQTSCNALANNACSKYDDDDGHIWSTIKVVKPMGVRYRVYNISVDTDPTYYADGVLVHNCTWTCRTMCGDGCMNGCTNGCTGCALTCESGCRDKSSSSTCYGCSSIGGCQTECMFDCNRNCMGKGCRSVCGTESSDSCESNCRLSCTGTSCTSMCSNACSDQCTTCVNSCGAQCGMCSSMCSTGCESACNIYCTQQCSNNCSENCVQSCSEQCGACSSLCFSCVGLCIGVCSVKCTNGCTSCANQCQWWCDSSCSRDCMATCAEHCISTCVGSCSTYLMSNTTLTSGPDRPPTAEGYQYPNPQNRWEERESFKLVQDIPRYVKPQENFDNRITIATIPNKYYVIVEGDFRNISDRIQRVISVDEENDIIVTSMSHIYTSFVSNVWKYTDSGHFKIHMKNIYPGEFIYLWDINAFGPFETSKMIYPDDNNIVVTCGGEVKYHIYQTSASYGVWEMDTNGNITVNPDMLAEMIKDPINVNLYAGIYIIMIEYPTFLNYELDYVLPYGFTNIGTTFDSRGNLLIIIKRDMSIYPTTPGGEENN